jgi:hypothetical protein
MDKLPNELIAQIASNADIETLLALATTSRHLREGSFSVYGPRFFQTLKFCLYPNSLQALSDISCSPHIAKYVQNVAFGTEDVGLLDPIHDVDFREGRSSHTDVGAKMLPMAKDDLSSARMRTDSALMSQALARFTKLEMVMIDEFFAIEGSEIRPSIGKSGLSQFSCHSHHCKVDDRSKTAITVYHTAALAVKQMRKSFSHVKLGISLAHLDYLHARWHPTFMDWYIDDDITRRTTNLQLNLPNGDSRSIHPGLDNLAKISPVDTMEVRHTGPIEHSHRYFSFFNLKLGHLRRLVLSNLCVSEPGFAKLWQKYRHQLTYLTLVKFSTLSRSFLSFQPLNPSYTSWMSVLHEL